MNFNKYTIPAAIYTKFFFFIVLLPFIPVSCKNDNINYTVHHQIYSYAYTTTCGKNAIDRSMVDAGLTDLSFFKDTFYLFNQICATIIKINGNQIHFSEPLTKSIQNQSEAFLISSDRTQLTLLTDSDTIN